MRIPIGPLLNFEDGLNPRTGSAFSARLSSTSPKDFISRGQLFDYFNESWESLCSQGFASTHGVPMNTLVYEFTNTVYQVSLVAGFGRNNMVMDYPQSRTDNTSSQSVVVLSMLIVILLTGRAIYVAISTDATLKGIFILIVYSSTLIFVGFIAGVNASNIRSRKKREISFSSNLEPSQTDVDFNPNLAQYNSTERFIIEFLLRHDGQCWQSNIVKESSMTNSKISRSLSKLESQGILTRVRDGMGKRVNLHKDELI